MMKTIKDSDPIKQLKLSREPILYSKSINLLNFFIFVQFYLLLQLYTLKKHHFFVGNINV